MEYKKVLEQQIEKLIRMQSEFPSNRTGSEAGIRAAEEIRKLVELIISISQSENK